MKSIAAIVRSCLREFELSNTITMTTTMAMAYVVPVAVNSEDGLVPGVGLDNADRRMDGNGRPALAGRVAALRRAALRVCV